jgi:hypothetical protein
MCPLGRSGCPFHASQEPAVSLAIADLDSLRSRCSGIVVTPADSGWDEARQAWNLVVDQRPAAVVVVERTADVISVMDFAREAGLRVAPQATGHNAAPLGDLAGTILVRTSALQGVSIDVAGRRARVGAGVIWQDVMEAAGAAGCAALAGSSPDVGVVGYSLGGGMGWLARRHGLAANSILAVELVTPDGCLVRADAEHEPELFWALRGGGGNFGVVCALEFALYPMREVYAGALAWDWAHSERVLERWSQWAAGAPDEVTTSARIMQLPPLPEIPEPLRGRRLVMIDGACTGAAADAEKVLAPLRELAPEIDVFRPMPPAGLIRVHGDPEHPVPAMSDHAMLAALPPEAVAAFVAASGPDSGSTLLFSELRQLGGALGRPAPSAGALPMLDAAFALFGVGMALTPEMRAAAVSDGRRLVEAMAPWTNGRSYLNFREGPTDVATGYRDDVLERLRRMRASVDPHSVMHANHEIARVEG